MAREGFWQEVEQAIILQDYAIALEGQQKIDEVVKNKADVWRKVLIELIPEIRDGHTKVSSYKFGEGSEGDSVTYGYKILSKNYRFYIECFYPPGNSKELRRFSVHVKSGFWGLFSRCIVRFDINKLICSGQKLSSLAQMPNACVQVHNILDQMSANKEVNQMFTRKS
ncbi:MAG: hypothetical protein Q8R29_01350 [bacterium]|nr:hypothetical protein [bacterium]